MLMKVESDVEESCQLMMKNVALLMVKLVAALLMVKFLAELLSGDDSAKFWWKEGDKGDKVTR